MLLYFCKCNKLFLTCFIITTFSHKSTIKAWVEGTYCHYYKTKLLLAVPGLIIINNIFLVKFWFISGKRDLRSSNLNQKYKLLLRYCCCCSCCCTMYTCTLVHLYMQKNCSQDSERFIHRVSNWWDRVTNSISSLIRLSIVIIQNDNIKIVTQFPCLCGHLCTIVLILPNLETSSWRTFIIIYSKGRVTIN